MGHHLGNLLYEARQLLGVSQGQLGELLGSSRHTGQRWESAGSIPRDTQLHKLAAMVHPRDPKLAAQLAAAGKSNLEALGIVPPVPPPSPVAPSPVAAPPPLPIEDVIDAIVCAAAEAIDVPPKTIRPALLAAFTRARRLRLSVDDVERGLGGKGAEGKAGAGSKRGSAGGR